MLELLIRPDSTFCFIHFPDLLHVLLLLPIFISGFSSAALLLKQVTATKLFLFLIVLQH